MQRDRKILSVEELETLLVGKKTKTIVTSIAWTGERRRKGQRSSTEKERERCSDQHWICFRGNAVETSERRYGMLYTGFPENVCSV